jgi:trimethylamine--corrinoid protein Co-methyltransferase
MRSNYTHFSSPQFRLLSDKQIEELHLASLHIMEKTGVAFESPEALELLGDAGADISSPERVKIPPHLAEQAINTAAKTITLYSREGQPAITLNGMTSHFGAINAMEQYLDPYSGKRRPCYVEDIADVTRMVDALPNIEWTFNVSSYSTIPGVIADKVSLIQSIRNTCKPVACCVFSIPSLEEMLECCSLVAGGEAALREKPFFLCSSEPISPLVQSREAVEKSLLCAERGVPNMIYSAAMAGATAPATFAGCLAIANAEFLSQLVMTQLKKPGAPVIYGAQPTIMDMRTATFTYGAPEMAFFNAALTEVGHYYNLPVFGTSGEVDADTLGIQATAETLYQLFLSALSGVDFVHGLGEMYSGRMASPELLLLCSELIDMVSVSMQGLPINEETLPLDLIERVGPGGTYISERHTLKHFRQFWVPGIFARSVARDSSTRSEELLREKTLDILKTHRPKPLPEDIARELEKIEASWLRQAGLTEYPGRP